MFAIFLIVPLEIVFPIADDDGNWHNNNKKSVACRNCNSIKFNGHLGMKKDILE